MNGKRPTRNQRKVIENNGLDPKGWYIQKDTSRFIQVVNVRTGETKTLDK